jgi:hypothetical protein
MIHLLNFLFCSEKQKIFKVQKPAIGNSKGAEVVETSVQENRQCSKVQKPAIGNPKGAEVVETSVQENKQC